MKNKIFFSVSNDVISSPITVEYHCPSLLCDNIIFDCLGVTLQLLDEETPSLSSCSCNAVWLHTSAMKTPILYLYGWTCLGMIVRSFKPNFLCCIVIHCLFPWSLVQEELCWCFLPSEIVFAGFLPSFCSSFLLLPPSKSWYVLFYHLCSSLLLLHPSQSWCVPLYHLCSSL